MSSPHILEEKPLTLSHVEAALDKMQKRDEELSFRAGKTLDHIHHLKPVKKKGREELVKKIEELEVPRLKPQHINKIVDVKPASVKELNIILSGYTLTVSKENQKKIVDVLDA